MFSNKVKPKCTHQGSRMLSLLLYNAVHIFHLNKHGLFCCKQKRCINVDSALDHLLQLLLNKVQ